MNKSNLLPESRTQRLERRVYEEAQAVVKQTSTFIEIVEEMNLGLEDPRLDTGRGTIEMIHELKTYNGLLGQVTIPIVNGDKDKNGNLLIFFEV